jgi:hypothetical protein
MIPKNYRLFGQDHATEEVLEHDPEKCKLFG